tara:strand:+ start:832 stop:1251 length:420 start_codon:yes stop_codon:yes gene_type:complete
MKMNKKLYDATLARLRSRALEALANLELSLANADSSGPPLNVDCITQHAEDLARLEGAIITLQQYFSTNQPAQPPSPPPAPLPAPEAVAKVAAEPPKKITEEMSPSYRKSIEAEKKRQKAEAERIKKEAKNSKSSKGKK